MNRLVLAATAIALAGGCSNSSSNNNNDMSAGPDMVAPGGTTTIAGARMGNMTGPITVTGVVIAIVGDDPVDIKEWYIQDPAGGPYSGVDVYCNHTAKSNACPMSVAVPALHDLITVTGSLSMYKGKLELAPTAQTKVMANAAAPMPAAVMASAIGPTSTDASLRGQLVKLTGTLPVDDVMPQALYDTRCAGDGGVNGSCTGCTITTFDGFQINDGSGHEVLVASIFHDQEHLVSSPECVAAAMSSLQVTTGKHFTMVSGILDVDPYATTANTVVVAPTSDTDYTLP